MIADLSVDIQRLADGIAAITFNGAVEWSLDYILTQDVIWLPTESQLRTLLGEAFRSLEATPTGFAVTVATAGEREDRFEATSAANAYGTALLASLHARA